ncbi:MAG: hypothetical protein ACRDFS_12945 [Chloroflexota bacterium]
MSHRLKILLSIVGAAALLASLFSAALASGPRGGHQATNSARQYKFNGRVTINNVLRVKKNTSVYGRAYAHGGEQVWNGLRVSSGGVKADSIDVAGPLNVDQNTILTGTLQAGATTVGGSLQVNGSTNMVGSLTSTGKLTSNGVDAQAGGLTTTGNISTSAGLSAGSIIDNGSLSASSVNSGGTVTAGGLTVTGPVNFTGANVTGLNLSNINLSGSGITSLTLGTSSSTSSPLTLTENNHMASLGVSSSGALSVGDLSVTGSGGLVTTSITAASGSNNSAGTLSLGSNTALTNGSDLSLSPPSNNIGGSGASHIVANGDYDVAGQVNISVTSGNSGAVVQPQTFAKPFTTAPIVTVTPADDPDPGSSLPPKVWVKLLGSSGNYTGFELHFQPGSSPGSNYSVTYDYQVIAR